MNERGANDCIEFACQLVSSRDRAGLIREFSRKIGFETLVIFIPDIETGELLAAPGFPQTLPGGSEWQALVRRCLAENFCAGTLPFPTRAQRTAAAGISAEGCVLVVIGEHAPREALEGFRSILPLLGAALGFERATLAEAAQAQIAAQAAKEAHALAVRLDDARREAQREIAGRARAEEELRRRTEVLEILNRTGSALAAQLDPAAIVRIVTEASLEITGVRYAGFCSVAEEKGGPELWYRPDTTPLEVFQTFCALGRSLSGWPPDGSKATVLPDLARVSGSEAEVRALVPCAGSLLMVPVFSRNGRVIGSLLCADPQTGRFKEDDEKVVAGIAAQTAIALDNALLYRALQTELAEHRRAEEALVMARDELTRTNAELDQRVHERTASLRDAVAQMEEFSYTVSHDLRAPLRAMQSYSGAVLDDYGGLLPTEAQRFLARIRDNAERLDRMILDVLTYSRVARATIELRTVDLNALISDIIHSHPLMTPPHAQIEIAELHPVLGHEPSLLQALSNLLTNAIKFVPQGTPPKVRIWTERENSEVLLSIADNGIGIPPQYHHRLFGMFERIHPKLGFEGTGIGLAIVRKAVERMNGECGVASSGEGGSRFWIKLRAAEEN